MITVLMNVWNSALWIEEAMHNVYPFCDHLVVTESCWVPGSWSGDTSPDGTAEIVKSFMRVFDQKDKIRFHQAGMVKDQPTGRNAGLHLVPPDTTYVMIRDSDEFFMEKDQRLLRKAMLDPRFQETYSHVMVEGKCFYFDFNWFKRESFSRAWRWFPGQKFHAIASMIPSPGKTFNTKDIGVEMFHMSYVSKEWTENKACIGEDVSEHQYRTWWNDVYNKFDGNNLEELYRINKGGVHVFGGGEVQRYTGDFPGELEHHPLRHVRWGHDCTPKD